LGASVVSIATSLRGHRGNRALLLADAFRLDTDASPLTPESRRSLQGVVAGVPVAGERYLTVGHGNLIVQDAALEPDRRRPRPQSTLSRRGSDHVHAADRQVG
jgi:hypothetical protein